MSDDRWQPIPEHAITIDGYPNQWVLPERLVEVEGRQYVRCELHGLIPADHNCAASPSDHLCMVAAHPNHTPGDDHDDQATPHDEWTRNLLARINEIRALHVKDVDDGGCKECGLGWPCPTFHFANGWGEMHDCWDAGWCSHVNEKVDAAEAGYPPNVFGSGYRDTTTEAYDRAALPDDALTCDNCGKTMAGHDHLARCFPNRALPPPRPEWSTRLARGLFNDPEAVSDG